MDFIGNWTFQAKFGAVLRIGSETRLLRRLYHLESAILAKNRKSDIFTEHLEADGVRAVVYRRLAWVAEGDEPEGPLRPCIVYFHGGGFVYCSPG